jgi:hypothetical protein
MEAMQCILDELARMKARFTSALAGHWGEQSAYACTSSDDGSAPDYIEPTNEFVDNFTFTCAHTNMGEPVGWQGSVAARSHYRTRSHHRKSLARSTHTSYEQTSTLAVPTATTSRIT